MSHFLYIYNVERFGHINSFLSSFPLGVWPAPLFCYLGLKSLRDETTEITHPPLRCGLAKTRGTDMSKCWIALQNHSLHGAAKRT